MGTNHFCDKCGKTSSPLREIKTDYGRREFCDDCFKKLMKLIGIQC